MWQIFIVNTADKSIRLYRALQEVFVAGILTAPVKVNINSMREQKNPSMFVNIVDKSILLFLV
jgi:hypothetical protein